MANAEHSGRTAETFGETALETTRARLRAARLGLWLVAAALAVRQVVVVLGTPRAERLTDLETWVGPDGVLHVGGSLYASTRFTGTPFTGLVLKPLTRAAEQALGWGWTFGTLLLVAALAVVLARALPQPVGRRTALLAAPVASSLLMLSLPVRNTLWLGQTSVAPVLLVLLGCFVARDRRVAGALVGVAAALQPTVLLFTVLLWCTGRRRTAAAAGATFAAGTALAWAAMPHDSSLYWVHHLAGAGLGGEADALANQSLHGALLRLGLTGPLEIGLFLSLGAVVAALGVRRAIRYARDGQLLLAVALTGCAAIAVSPTTWQHQLLWVLPTVVGRVGRRASDRYVWPVAVVVVMTLPGAMTLPHMEVLRPLRDNAVLLLALAAATVVPFLPRTSPHYRTPIPTECAEPVPARVRHVPLLPFLKRVLTRPNLLLELLLLRVTYAAYQQVRLAATGGTNSGGRARAEAHGRDVLGLERRLHLDIERGVNHWVVGVTRLRDFFDFYYSSLHFVVPLAVLAVLYWRRPVDYRWARSSLGFATLLALVGFWLYPLAPPRLMPGLGVVDTVHGVQDFSKPDYGTLTSLTNQYAAMPSLHFGWSLWCGLVIAVVARGRWTKSLGLLHPLFTVSAIVATGNHWVLDAVGGAAVVCAGFGLSYALMGPRALTTTPGRTTKPKPPTTQAPPTTPASPTTPTPPTPQPTSTPPPPSASSSARSAEKTRQ